MVPIWKNWVSSSWTNSSWTAEEIWTKTYTKLVYMRVEPVRFLRWADQSNLCYRLTVHCRFILFINTAFLFFGVLYSAVKWAAKGCASKLHRLLHLGSVWSVFSLQAKFGGKASVWTIKHHSTCIPPANVSKNVRLNIVSVRKHLALQTWNSHYAPPMLQLRVVRWWQATWNWSNICCSMRRQRAERRRVGWRKNSAQDGK